MISKQVWKEEGYSPKYPFSTIVSLKFKNQYQGNLSRIDSLSKTFFIFCLVVAVEETLKVEPKISLVEEHFKIRSRSSSESSEDSTHRGELILLDVIVGLLKINFKFILYSIQWLPKN